MPNFTGRGDYDYEQTIEETRRLMAEYTEWLSGEKGGFWEAEEMPRYAQVDYRILRDKQLKFYVEVKIRNNPRGKYDKEKVPYSKFTWAYTQSRLEGVKSYLMVKWEDAIGLVDLEKIDSTGEMQAREDDRGNDWDLYAFYNEEDFKLVPIWYDYSSNANFYN